jgi:hypothetical protein
MTAGAERTSVATTPDEVGSQEGARCAVCDHHPGDHDAISQRYCQATQAHALPRGCICPQGSARLARP